MENATRSTPDIKSLAALLLDSDGERFKGQQLIFRHAAWSRKGLLRMASIRGTLFSGDSSFPISLVLICSCSMCAADYYCIGTCSGWFCNMSPAWIGHPYRCLMIAGPGTGKTWSSCQLMYHLSKAMAAKGFRY